MIREEEEEEDRMGTKGNCFYRFDRHYNQKMSYSVTRSWNSMIAPVSGKTETLGFHSRTQ